MLKEPKGGYKRSGSLASLGTVSKVILVVEAAALFGCYYVWRRMNTSQEFRKRMYDSYPSVLNGYYKGGEFIGAFDTRTYDYKCWGVSHDS